MAIDIPIPKIGPINGEINMAPITTAVEFAFNPTDATNMEQIKIHAVAPLKECLFYGFNSFFSISIFSEIEYITNKCH